MEKDYDDSKPSPVVASTTESPPVYGEAEKAQASVPRRIFDSFKRDPNAHITSGSAAGKSFDVEHAAENTAASPLQRSLKSRHLQMIAIGGSIGTGLFIGSGMVVCCRWIRCLPCPTINSVLSCTPVARLHSSSPIV
jgi:amino acid transporter